MARPHAPQIAAEHVTLPELITVEVAAARLSTPIGTIRDWIQKRRITSYRPGRRVLVSLAELAAMLEASARPALPREGA